MPELFALDRTGDNIGGDGGESDADSEGRGKRLACTLYFIMVQAGIGIEDPAF